jgi:LAO/AO transport system kinase
MKINDLAKNLVSGDRRALAKAITLVESALESDRKSAYELIDLIMVKTGGARRIGISGMPGVGKSTFIEMLGMKRIAAGDKIAVLAVDPSSPITGGSIMGDRTRMEDLSSAENAFIRPSPAGKTLGGVTQRTRESILLCEAAGYDTILVETVGVGQSEAAVASMVDCFVLLQLPNSGDELQGIKKGVLELANIIVVTKNDGSYQQSAQMTKGQLERALMLTRGTEDWPPPVLLSSAIEKTGFEEFWRCTNEFHQHQKSSGAFESNRSEQRINWFHEELNIKFLSTLNSNTKYSSLIEDMEAKIEKGQIAASIAALNIVSDIFK